MLSTCSHVLSATSVNSTPSSPPAHGNFFCRLVAAVLIWTRCLSGEACEAGLGEPRVIEWKSGKSQSWSQHAHIKKGACGLNCWTHSLPGQSATIWAQYSLLAMAFEGERAGGGWYFGSTIYIYILHTHKKKYTYICIIFITWPCNMGRASCSWHPSHIEDWWNFTFLAKHSLSVPTKSTGTWCATPFSAKLIAWQISNFMTWWSTWIC